MPSTKILVQICSEDRSRLKAKSIDIWANFRLKCKNPYSTRCKMSLHVNLKNFQNTKIPSFQWLQFLMNLRTIIFRLNSLWFHGFYLTGAESCFLIAWFPSSVCPSINFWHFHFLLMNHWHNLTIFSKNTTWSISAKLVTVCMMGI